MTLEIDIDQAIKFMKRLSDEQLPKFAKMFMNDLSLETRKVMIQKVSGPEIAVITGNMRSSIIINTMAGGFEVGPSILDPPYPEFVGLGTSKMAPRPFHEWTMTIMKKRIVIIGDQLTKEILRG